MVGFTEMKTQSRFSCRSFIRSKPAKDEEVVATERAPEGQKQPAESCLQGVPVAHAPEIDRSATRTTCEQHLYNTSIRPARSGMWE